MGYRGGSSSSSTAQFETGSIIAWSGSLSNIPEGWSLCNGSNSTPNMTNRYLLATSSSLGTGGSSSHSHSVSGIALPGDEEPPPFAAASKGQMAAAPDPEPEPGEANHSHMVDGSTNSRSNLPLYYRLFFIRKD